MHKLRSTLLCGMRLREYPPSPKRFNFAFHVRLFPKNRVYPPLYVQRPLPETPPPNLKHGVETKISIKLTKTPRPTFNVEAPIPPAETKMSIRDTLTK